MKSRRVVGSVACIVAMAATVVVAPIWGAGAGDAIGGPPGSLIGYRANSAATELRSVTFRTTVLADPGRANVFWAHSIYTSDGGPGGYIGIQRHRVGPGGFLFSVWGSTSGQPGSPGTSCNPYEEDGSGYSCHMPGPFVLNHRYELTVRDVGAGALQASVWDATARKGFVIGTLQGPSTRRLTPHVSDWTEYFDGGTATGRCGDAAYSKAIFGYPVGTDAEGNPVTYRLDVTIPGPYCAETFDLQESSTVVRNAFGNSTSGNIGNKRGECLGIVDRWNPAGAAITVEMCDASDRQNWVLGYNGTVHAAMYCLTVSGDAAKPVVLALCDGSSRQIWMTVDGVLRNPETSTCIDVGRPLNALATAMLAPCTSSAGQRWTVPAKAQS